MAETEIQICRMKWTDYTKGNPEKVTEEVRKQASLYGTQATMKKGSVKYSKTSVTKPL